MSKKLERRQTILLLIFWINIIILSGILLFLLYHTGIGGKSITEDDFMYERFGIIFILILIPISLKFYHNRHSKILALEEDKYLSKMSLYYYLRILLIDFAIVFNLACFYSIGAMNFFYLALIGILSFFVCYPNMQAYLSNNKNEIL